MIDKVSVMMHAAMTLWK